ncbi:MAG: hypothetical protein R6X12_04840 [bacterium]
MRRLLPLLLLGALVTCRRFDNPLDPANNQPPGVPDNPVPAVGAEKQDTVGLMLSWTCADPDSAIGDSLTYDVYFGSVIPPPRVVSAISATEWATGPLALGLTFRWRVVARDARGDTTPGPVWHFTTNANQRPSVPANPVPGNGADGLPTGVALSWQGGDPNSGDTLAYDLYLGRTDPPPLILAGLDEPGWTVAGLDHSRTYHWRVVARDQDSAETSGPVWQFSTMSQVEFISPAGGEKWRIGTQNAVRWSGGTDRADGIRPKVIGKGVKVPGWPAKDDADSTVLYHSPDSGAVWLRIARVSLSGQYNWFVTGPEGPSAMVQVRIHVGPHLERASSNPFMVYDAPSPITVTSPSAGARWRVGEHRTIAWSGGTDGSDSAVTFYSTDNGRNWIRLGRAVQAGSYDWLVPAPTTDSAQVRVRSYVADLREDGVSGRFSVAGPQPVFVTAPDSNSRWRAFTLQTVGWYSEASPIDSAVVSHRPDTIGSWQRQGKTTGSSYAWMVPLPATDRAQVLVELWQGQSNDAGTSSPFVIYDTLPPAPIVVLSPAGGEAWLAGSTHDILWSGGTDGVDSAVVSYSPDDGGTWSRQGLAREPGRFRWTLPSQTSDLARVVVRAWCLGRSTQGVSNRFRIAREGYPDSVVATVAVGSRPVAGCWNSRESKLYVANYTSGTVTVISGTNDSVIATVTVGSYPTALVYDSLRNKVYCANEGNRSVTVIDGANNAVLGTVMVGTAPRALAYNSTSGRVYVANYGTGANSVSVIDGATDSVIATVPCGERPRALAWNPVHNRVYVACYAGNVVTVFDGETNAVIDSVQVGYAPCAVAVVGDRHHIYVANSGPGSNSVSVIDAVNNSIVAHVPVGARPCALAWNPTANMVYAVSEAVGSVAVIRTADQQVVSVVGVGSLPGAVVWASSVNMAYIACRGSDQVAIINGSTNALAKLLGVGSEPRALVWNPLGGRVYAVNDVSGTVSVIGYR